MYMFIRSLCMASQRRMYWNIS